MSNHYSISQLGILEYNSCLRRHKNKTLSVVLDSYKLIKVKENGRVTVYTCKKMKHALRMM
jgi:hypothetical protein